MDDRTPSSGVIRNYRLERKLGEGGMGVVYEAFDPQLERNVAIKMIREGIADETQRRRLMREARVAAGINHPNICHVYEVGEESGELYIVMELLEGESLADRIERGPLPLPESLEVTLGILAALGGLHDRSIIHRDLKPSNVFLTPHGVKLLDFGLARSTHGDPRLMDVTQPGAIMGTPRYMAPEQWTGSAVVPATDVFALGAILFEMVAGRPVFEGATAMEICHAIANADPETLQGGREMALIDRVIHHALIKNPAERYESAEAMAAAVRAALRAADSGDPPAPEIAKRLMVLPFRLLRADPEVEFLTTSLPEAIVVSLSSLDSLVVRSSAVAVTGSGDQVDLQAISREAGVDAVLTGSVLRAGDQVRLTTQLIETPGGAILASKAAQVSMGDILQVHDDLVREIIESLSISLTSKESRRLNRDKPASAMTYDRYLRANQFSNNRRLLGEARDLYLQCLQEDPRYAPAWARLGRLYRVMAKYQTDGNEEENFRLAKEAFGKALEIDPELSLAHNLYTFLEVEEMGRAKEAMVRLLERASTRPSDADLFAGLVLACRFCGLLTASVEADRRARRIDPGIQTSVQYTYWLMGDYERAMAYDTDDMRWTFNYALLMVGRESEGAERLRKLEASDLPGLEKHVARVPRAALEGNRDECVKSARILLDSRFHDPEGLYFMGRSVAKVGDRDLALEMLERVVSSGLSCYRTMQEDFWLDDLRSEPRFKALLDQAEEQYRDAQRAFIAANGERLLGVSG